MAYDSKLSFEPYLNIKNATTPGFTADGSRLIYLSDISGTFQVWSALADGGEAEELTFFDERVTLVEPSPAGNGCLITRDRGGDEQDQLYWLNGDRANEVEIVELSEDPKVKHIFGSWSRDGRYISFSSNARHPASFDVYVMEVKPGAQPELVMQGEGWHFPGEFSRSGRYLLVSRYNTNTDLDIFLLDLENRAAEPRLLVPHTSNARFINPSFSAQDEGLYLITDLERDFLALMYLDLATLQLKEIAGPPWDVNFLKISPDGKWLVYGVNENGYTRLYLHNLISGTKKEISGLSRGIIYKAAWSQQADKLCFEFQSPIHSSDIWLYDLQTSQLKQVTQSPGGGLDRTSFIMPDVIYYPSFDGLQIPALWYVPEGAKRDGSLPVIISIHGGPEAQAVFAWTASFQYWLRQGYAVLAPNVRGSTGYGNYYQSLDDVRLRMGSVADLKYAWEWLGQQGYADIAKITVYGASYGGFMVLSALTTYPELWAAGVDIVGTANWLTFMENTSSYRRKLRAAEYGDPEVDREFLVEISPINKADLITAALLVIHGARDPRVPVGEAEQIVASLRGRNQPVEYLRFEDEGHGITKLQNKLIMFPAIAEFFRKYLGGEVAAP